VTSLKSEAEAINFLNEAYKHCKPIAASAAGIELLENAGSVKDVTSDERIGENRPDTLPSIVISRNTGSSGIGVEQLSQ
jgi:hypothetical protein